MAGPADAEEHLTKTYCYSVTGELAYGSVGNLYGTILATCAIAGGVIGLGWKAAGSALGDVKRFLEHIFGGQGDIRKVDHPKSNMGYEQR